VNAPLPRSALAFAAPLALILAGCTKPPPVPSPIDDETVCVDYEIAATHAKMHGGMRRPVVLTVLSGKDVVAQKILSGLNGLKAAKTTIDLPDADAEYQLDWAQCGKRLGPYPMEQPVPVLECDAPVYKSDKLVTKKGNPASRTINFVLPPEAGCWLDENAPLPGASAAPVQAPAPVK
jgi:hypothetical protein